jgi:DNA adenine methylase
METKPFLKWVGGKAKILDDLFEVFPLEVDNYHEIFLGGGSVLFNFLSSVKNKKIKLSGEVYAYDLNEALIYLYKNIQNDYNLFYNVVESIGKVTKENYYDIRKRYNQLTDKKTMEASALFLVLNKTCFRGLYRTGPNGFNVPYGNYLNPIICSKEHLKEISELIKSVHFECCDFSVSLNKPINLNDFIYLDPPYAPVKENSFVSYNLNGFDLKTHLKLFETIKNLRCKFAMSNAKTNLVETNFEEYEKKYLTVRRSINSKNPESMEKELIVYQ